MCAKGRGGAEISYEALPGCLTGVLVWAAATGQRFGVVVTRSAGAAREFAVGGDVKHILWRGRAMVDTLQLCPVCINIAGTRTLVAAKFYVQNSSAHHNKHIR